MTPIHYALQIIICAVATVGGVIASKEYIPMKLYDILTERGYHITYGGWMSWIVLAIISTMFTILWQAQLH